MHSNIAPIKLRILISKIGRRTVTELPVHSDFFKLVIQRIGFSEVVRVAELSNEVGGTYEEALFRVFAVRIVRRWKSRTFDGAGDPGGIEQFTLLNAVHHKQLRSVDVVGDERCVGRTTRKSGFAAPGVNHVSVGTISFENAPHVADIIINGDCLGDGMSCVKLASVDPNLRFNCSAR